MTPDKLLALQNRLSAAVDAGTQSPDQEITIRLSLADVALISYGLGLATSSLMPPRAARPPEPKPVPPRKASKRKAKRQ